MLGKFDCLRQECVSCYVGAKMRDCDNFQHNEDKDISYDLSQLEGLLSFVSQFGIARNIKGVSSVIQERKHFLCHEWRRQHWVAGERYCRRFDLGCEGKWCNSSLVSAVERTFGSLDLHHQST